MTLLLQLYVRRGASATTRTCFFSGHEFILKTMHAARHVSIHDATSSLIAPLTHEDFDKTPSPIGTPEDADLCLILQDGPQSTVYLIARRRNEIWEDLTDARNAKSIGGDSLYGDILGVLATLIERHDAREEAA